MSTWSESRLKYPEVLPLAPSGAGPLERLWQSTDRETVFLSRAELERKEDAARRSGTLEAESRLKQAFETALNDSRRELLRSIAAFHSDRATYFHDMEREVVRLALAIGRSVTERELQVNPTLLEEAVRDILQRIESTSKIRLRVPAADVAAWTAALVMERDQGLRAEIVAGENLQPGACIVETSLGSTEFNIPERLREIEATMLQCIDTRESLPSRPTSVQ